LIIILIELLKTDDNKETYFIKAFNKFVEYCVKRKDDLKIKYLNLYININLFLQTYERIN